MKHIASRENAFFKQLKRLAQSGRERNAAGKTVLDGVHLIQACEAAGLPVESLIVDEAALQQPEIAALIASREVVVLASSLFRDAAVVESPSGIMAVITMPAGIAADPALDSIVLDGVQDPGNVGTLLRTAAAAGFQQAVLSESCAAPWSPKVLRAGQGAQFAMRIVTSADLPAFLKAFKGTVAVTHLAGAVSLYDAPLSRPMAWVFGSEGQGVSEGTLALATLRVKIPMPGAMESLNVGAAAAVCLFETLRRRS